MEENYNVAKDNENKNRYVYNLPCKLSGHHSQFYNCLQMIIRVFNYMIMAISMLRGSV